MEEKVVDICETVQDGILLDPTISLDDSLSDNIATAVKQGRQ